MLHGGLWSNFSRSHGMTNGIGNIYHCGIKSWGVGTTRHLGVASTDRFSSESLLLTILYWPSARDSPLTAKNSPWNTFLPVRTPILERKRNGLTCTHWEALLLMNTTV